MNLSQINIPGLVEDVLHDVSGRKHPVHSNIEHIQASLSWLKRAQDVCDDGGAAAWYSLISGWAHSYVETTGYIINTFLDCAEFFDESELKDRAIKMGEFLLEMQYPSGGFRTHALSKRKDSYPTIFDTGQDLLGLTSLYKVTHRSDFKDACIKAANFLCDVQEPDGNWLQHSFRNQAHTYHTRVAWGLLKVAEISDESRFVKHARLHLDWAAKNQRENGWFTQNELQAPDYPYPLTHTISYAIEGFLESGILLQDEKFCRVARRGAEPVLRYYLAHHFLPASFTSDWTSPNNYSCVTGSAQLAHVWLQLGKYYADEAFFRGAKELIASIKTQQNLQTSDVNRYGGMKGSAPIYGDLFSLSGYCRLAYPNWAAKFWVDALLLDEKLLKKNHE